MIIIFPMYLYIRCPRRVPEAVAAESGVEHGAEDGEALAEAIQRPGLPAPYQPTQAEIDNHNLTHLPYRTWCPVCVKAKGKASGHRSVESHHNAGVPVISADYAFLCESGEILDLEGDGDDAPVCKITGGKLQPMIII